MTIDERLKPIHPGEILKEELLIPLNISEKKLAEELKVDEQVIQEIVEKKRSITPSIALRLSLYFTQSAQFWLNCQRDYEKDCLEEMEKVEIYELKKKIHPYQSKNKEKSIERN